MTSQEEVIQPDNVAKVRQDVAKPGDQPAESKDCTHLSSDKAIKKNIRTINCSTTPENKVSILVLEKYEFPQD